MRYIIMSLILVLCMALIALPGAAEAYETYICEEQSFSFEYDPDYSVEWQDGNGAVIYTEVDGSIPYVMVWRCEDLIAEPLEYIKEQFTPYMQQKYGDDLGGYIEYEMYDIGGKQLPAALYTYRIQDYVINMLRAYDSTGEQTVTYTAKYVRGEEQATLAALERAVNSYKPIGDYGVSAPAENNAVADGFQLASHEIRSADGVLIGRCAAPADFTVDSYISDVTEDFSIGIPMRVMLTADSADGLTRYAYRSACDYIHYIDVDNAISGAVHQDGVMDQLSLTTMLQARNAAEYADYVITSLFPGVEFHFESQSEPGTELKAFAQQQQAEILARAQSLASVTPGINIDGAYWDAIERRYSFSYEGENFIAVVAVSVDGYQMTAMTYGLNNIGSSVINWGPKATYIYLTPASQYDAGRPGFDAFMLNTSVSDQFIKSNQDMSNQIRELMVQGRDMSSASIYSRNNLSSIIDSGEDYADSFTDYIFDQNDYTTSEGEHIKLPTSFDYVYEDGDGNVFASNAAPSSDMTLLRPNH